MNKSAKILGSILIVAGVALLAFCVYTKSEVAGGRAKISEAQGKVDRGKRLFSWNPCTRKIGEKLVEPAQDKIDEGSHEANYYSGVAHWCKWGGIALLIIGTGTLFLGRKKSRK